MKEENRAGKVAGQLFQQKFAIKCNTQTSKANGNIKCNGPHLNALLSRRRWREIQTNFQRYVTSNEIFALTQTFSIGKKKVLNSC